ncbi:MAG TPA: type VI secretion system tip protein TssI/VgrG [Polyangiaceae bacterium]|nr:type VI secretion system tip protein TssI/VgrG [Polyangiaceae bacterium]
MAMLELNFASGESTLSVRRFSIKEQMSNPFEVYVVALSPNDEIDMEAIVGKPATFSMAGGVVPRSLTGICSHMGQVQAEVKGLSTYELVIVPDLWLLAHRSGHRIFQHQTIPEIVLALLGEWQIEPEMKIDAGSYPKQEYRLQYGETDFAFFERLLEEAGISYYFADQGPGKTKLVLSDTPHLSEPRAGLPIPFVDNPNQAARMEFMNVVNLAHGVRPGSLTVRDFDFRRRTDYKLFGEGEKAPPPEDLLEQYHYIPGSSLIEVTSGGGETPVADDKSKARHDDKELKARAGRWLEASRADKRRVVYESNVLDLHPGVVFKIDHPHETLTPAQGLLAVASLIHGTHDSDWALAGEAVFASQPYRPQVVTPKPRIEGLQSAIVVGPSGQEIHTDEFGRVRVRFHWDREGEWDDNRTCWVRVSQGWAGAMYGQMMIPRVGQEVIVDFLDGDPDQPIIVGRLYNATTQVPYTLPRYKTRSTWKSDSSPSSDGYNEIMFEDSAGQEVVWMQAQKDLAKVVKRNESERTGGNRSFVIGSNRSATIAANDSVEVGVKHSIVIAEPKDLQILNLGQPVVEPKKTKIEMSDKKILLTTGDATILLDGPNIFIEAKEGINILAEGEVIIQGGPNVYLNCDCPPMPSGQGACLLAAARSGAAFVQQAP